MNNYKVEDKELKKIIRNILIGGLAGMTLIASYDMIDEHIKNTSKKTQIEEINKFQTDDGYTYIAPIGYYLDVIDGKVCAVRNVENVIDATIANGSYTTPMGYHLEDDKAVRVYKKIIDPIIIKTDQNSFTR